ncbi:MAG TPA: Ig-like domain-containing protein [bacterium]|nr:Ig-like domain-containing protein [bacterium]HPN45616.1 Ig-like domain-containing protein [bacterium]
MNKTRKNNMNKLGIYNRKNVFSFLVIFVLILLGSEFGFTESHPIWNPTGDVTTLQTSVADYVNMTDTQLRSQLTTAGGKAEPHNIEMVDITYNFALLYHLTGNSSYAHKSAVLLDRYAEVFPSWPLDYSDSRGHYMWWDNWFHRDLGMVARYLAQAYDLLYNSGAFEAIAAGTRDKVKSFLIKVVQVDFGYQFYFFNAAGTRPLGIMVFGRVLDDPELVHLGFWYYNQMIHEMYTYEGFFYEGNYEYMASHVGTLSSPDYKFFFEGYSDPPGYVHTPFDSRYDPTRIDNLNFDALFKPKLDRMLTMLWDTTFPDLIWPVLNETFSYPIGYSSRGYHYLKSPLQNTTLMGGIGHAALTYGTGRQQTQVRFDFSPSIGHQHADALHLLYYCKDEEVVGGTGYSHMDRDWNFTTLNQNLVVVNGVDQKYDYWTNYTYSPYIPGQGRISGRPVTQPMEDTNLHNNILIFEPAYQDFDKVQVVEVDAKDAYSQLNVSRYQRMLALTNIVDNDMYLVDFFRVKGGTQYDWTIHGGHVTLWEPVHPPYSANTNLAMSSTSGTFGKMNFTQRATTGNNWYGEFNYNGVINRFIMCGKANTTVYRGTGPQSVKDATTPHDYFVARRTASTSTDENFLVVHETYTSAPHIQSIEQLTFTGDVGTAIGVKITLDNGIVDYVIHTLDDGPSYPARQVSGVDNLVIKGRFGHIRVTNNVVTWMKLVQGASLSYGTRMIQSTKGDYAYRGSVTDVNRKEGGDSENSFVVNTSLPSNGDLVGQTLIVTWGNGWKWGYKIKNVIGNRVITEEDPGFNLNGSTVDMKYFPTGQYAGPVTFIIPGTAVMDENGLINSVEGEQVSGDVTPPTVLSSVPLNNAQDIDGKAPIVITFSEAMNTGSVQSAFSITPAANMGFNWSGNILTLTPLTSLAATQQYVLKISGAATDIAGNFLDGDNDGTAADDFILNFKTKTPPAPVYLFVEAETGTLTAPMVLGSDPLAFGYSFVQIPNGAGNTGNGAAEIPFSVPANDTYIIWGRIIAPTGSDDSYFVLLDNDRERIWDCLYDNSWSPNWKWDMISERGTGTFDNPQYDPGLFTLTAGTHVLKLKQREDGVMLDRILVTNDLSFNPETVTGLVQYNLPAGYGTVALPVKNDKITKASELAAAIEAQLGANTVNGISYWNQATQKFVSFAPHLPAFLQGPNFTIPIGLPILTNTTTSGNWTLIGTIDEINYSLGQGYNTIALELTQSAITKASELATAIEAQIGANAVNGLSYWNTATQKWVSYAPHLPVFLRGTDFQTYPGHYYLVNMVTSGNF